MFLGDASPPHSGRIQSWPPSPNAVCGELCSELPHFGRHGNTDGSRQDLCCSPSTHAAAGGAAGGSLF